MRADLDALLTAIYVLVDDFLPERQGPGAPPRISDAELSRWRLPRSSSGCPTTGSSSRWRAIGSGTCFPTCPSSRATTSGSGGWCPRSPARSTTWPSSRRRSATDPASRLDPGALRAVAPDDEASEFAGLAGYGYCRSHSRYFWGFRLDLVCARDGTLIAFELAPANAAEREVAKELLERVPLAGYVLIADKGFAGENFEGFVAEQEQPFCVPTGATSSRERLAGVIRQCIESVFWTCKGQLGPRGPARQSRRRHHRHPRGPNTWRGMRRLGAPARR